MSNNSSQTISTINQTLQDNANARMVYAEPVKLANKIVLPVAKIIFGYGSGDVEVGTLPHTEHSNVGGGEGGGGGLIAYPSGVFEITEKRTRFIAASNKAIWGLSLALAFLLGSAVGARKIRW